MKLCKDCRHYRLEMAVYHMCYRGVTTTISLITGKEELTGTSSMCRDERYINNAGFCGEAGQYWEKP